MKGWFFQRYWLLSTATQKHGLGALALAGMLALSACASVNQPAGTPAYQQTNKQLKKQLSPVRYQRQDNGDVVLSWAGKPEESVTKTADQVRQDVFQAIYKRCGFTPQQLVETRQVVATRTHFYEVWVFTDPTSTRSDGKSAVSVLMQQLPNGGGVRGVVGQCYRGGAVLQNRKQSG